MLLLYDHKLLPDLTSQAVIIILVICACAVAAIVAVAMAVTGFIE